ncbi:uncharacterized protein UTRI_02220 [Ustilago trichophora]|uniref:Uncharacterized protein n=1 Tax=Ustilago trichophora TaxID=86804 RepID=A0A5C3E238_9BASI|nr:uncharacterized protein UTRI_02220 [Ustilago trichophora]
MQAGSRLEILAIVLCLALVGLSSCQSISRPPASLPVQSYSDDPLITGSAASAALCTLYSILGTESAAHGIGPLTVQPNCMSMTLQPHSTASINGQTLPSSGIVTIFEPSSTSSGASMSSTRPTTAPLVSSSASTPAQSTASTASTTTSSAAQPRQTNAGKAQNKPPAAASWIASQNIAILLVTTFALLAGVTYFLDELLAILV